MKGISPPSLADEIQFLCDCDPCEPEAGICRCCDHCTCDDCAFAALLKISREEAGQIPEER